jgi:hypothetical protein
VGGGVVSSLERKKTSAQVFHSSTEESSDMRTGINEDEVLKLQEICFFYNLCRK